MPPPLLEVDGLRTQFATRRGTVRAVDGVSFSLARGETLGIVGESGSGKSMTALSIMRLVPAPAGRIVGGTVRLDGVDLIALSEREMRHIRGRRIAMIFQDPMSALDPLFTIGEQIAEPIRQHQGLAGPDLKDKVEESLTLVGIAAPGERVAHYPHQMSGGMRQRIVGAIGLSCEPDVLIADEPTTALDVTVQAQYLRLLKDVQQALGLALIVITHDLGVVAAICDHVAVMYAGRIVETATARDLFDRPAHPYTRALLDSLPRLDARGDQLAFIPGHPPDPVRLVEGCAFAPRCREVMDICRRTTPPAIGLGTGRMAECWLHQPG
jgi:oligopeptide/dipeptide ABC transporter ATP-binding protein